MLSRCGTVWMVMVVAGVSAVGWGADAPVAAGGGFAGLVGELRSPVYAKREAATVALMRLEADRRGEVEEALAQEKDAEAAGRLARVAVHLFMKGQTSLSGDVGVLGISLKLEAVQLDPKVATVQMAIVVVKTQPGFPAAEMLEVGDRIVAVNGERLSIQSDQDDFKKKINDTKPGRAVRLMVLRDGKILDLAVKVAGLRANDVPLFRAMVDQRDQQAELYAQQLQRGSVGWTVVVPGGGGAVEGQPAGLGMPETLDPP